MAIPHAQPMDIVDVRPLGTGFDEGRTTTLVKTKQLELIRLVLPAGKQVSEHQVAGEITVQCLEGQVEFTSNDVTRPLSPGDLVFLAGASTHSLRAIENSSLLLTIRLHH
jgi:quercetin dioxygenase-like cupin family protein